MSLETRIDRDKLLGVVLMGIFLSAPMAYAAETSTDFAAASKATAIAEVASQRQAASATTDAQKIANFGDKLKALDTAWDRERDSTFRRSSNFESNATGDVEAVLSTFQIEQLFALNALQSSDRRQSSRQLAAPSLVGNATSLSSRALSPDVLGLALNLRSLTGSTGSGSEDTSAAASFSAYAVAAAIYGQDPNDDAFSQRFGSWRRLTFQLAYDDQQGESKDRVVAAGVKYNFDTSFFNQEAEEELRSRALEFGTSLADLTKQTGLRLSTFEAANEESGLAAAFRTTSFRGLNSQANAKAALRHYDELAQARARVLKGSLEITTRQGTGAPDEYAGMFILEKAVMGRLQAVGNAGFEYKEISGAKDQYGGKGVLDLILPLGPQRPGGILPTELSVGVEANWLQNEKDTYKGQFKLELPVPKVPGLRIPLSVTFANRRDLISESEVRGIVGFTIDPTAFLKGLDGLGL